MGSQPITPKPSPLPVAGSSTPSSPCSHSNVKRKQSAFFDLPELNPWTTCPLTPPFSEPVAFDVTPTKRTRIAWHRSDTDAVFAEIEGDIDATAPTDSQLETQLLVGPDVIDFDDVSFSLTPRVGPACVLEGRGQGSHDTYADEAIDSILAGPSDDYPSLGASLYDGVDEFESADDEVCFGMIKVDSFEPATDLSLPSFPRSVARINNLQWTQTGTVFYKERGSLVNVGNVRAPMPEILARLSQQHGMSVQLHCIFMRTVPDGAKRKGSGSAMRLEANLYANLYGPFGAFDSVGDFLEDCDICLQDPEGCDRNVRYRNPHRISGRDEDAPMTVDREITVQRSKVEPTIASPDYFDSLAMHSELRTTEGSPALKTTLKPHQQQALFFMLTREQGWSFDGPLDDIWTRTDIGGVRMYLNAITDEAQLPAPPEFRGGLLADQMGLGKTLSIISLITSDFYPSNCVTSIRLGAKINLSSHYSKCTLVIVPPNLLDTWESQLQEHCQLDTIRWSRHHDKSRFAFLSEMTKYHVILTTYNTVSAEWRSHKTSSILYSTDWHRIVLDEAHYIKGERNQLSRAIYDLKAYRRWAVTGTPIQNHLNDLEALLKFLRLHPYDVHTNFERDITSLWKTDSEAAIARLKRLISCITLRRTGSAVQLPPKSELLFTLPFSTEEQELYGPLEAKVADMMNQPDVCGSSTAAGRAHALKGLHILRSICNLGVLTDTRKFLSNQDSATAWGPSDAQFVFETLTMSSVTLCTKCGTDVTALNTSTAMASTEAFCSIEADPVVSQCERIICGTCASSLQQGGDLVTDWCGHIPPCATFSVSTSQASIGSLSSLGSRAVDPTNLPTKIQELVKNIRIHSTSKSVVFSSWRTTLDLAALGLTSADIKFTRYDGEVKHIDRASALISFRDDPSMQVLLITTSCGAVGLNLTAADRAYIMEPQWNPTVEDQALSRIHRFGQQKPVTIIRFVMADSIEQRVIEVKSGKKDFAELLFASRKRGLQSGNDRGNFARWRTLLS